MILIIAIHKKFDVFKEKAYIVIIRRLIPEKLSLMFRANHSSIIAQKTSWYSKPTSSCEARAGIYYYRRIKYRFQYR